MDSRTQDFDDWKFRFAPQVKAQYSVIGCFQSSPCTQRWGQHVLLRWWWKDYTVPWGRKTNSAIYLDHHENFQSHCNRRMGGGIKQFLLMGDRQSCMSELFQMCVTEGNINLMTAYFSTRFKMQSLRNLKVPSFNVTLWIPCTFWTGL